MKERAIRRRTAPDSADGTASRERPDDEELRAFVRQQLRGSRTPDKVVFRTELPTNATGKVLRRDLITELNSTKEHA